MQNHDSKMSRIVIIQNKRLLKSFLRQQFSGNQDNGRVYRYLDLGESTQDTLQLLKDKGIKEAVSTSPGYEREKFLKEYIDLIGALSLKHHSLAWWATDFSSKNRFTSKLTYFLQQFLLAIEHAKKSDKENLVVFNISWVVISALKKALDKEDIAYTSHEDHLERCVAIFLGFLRRVASVFVNTFRICVNKGLAQIYARRVPASGQKYYVIKTFVYDQSFTKDGCYQDSFFGPLPDFLKDKKNLLILANILGDYKNCIRQMKNCVSPLIVPLESFLSFFDVIQCSLRILFYRLRINHEALFFGYDVGSIVSHELSRSCFKIQPYHFLHFRCIEKLLKRIQVETILFTYENNPFTTGIGRVVLKYVQKHHLVSESAKKGKYLLKKLNDLKKLDMVGDVRGLGLMTAVELVQNKKTRKPFSRKKHVAEKVLQAALKKGLNLYFAIGFTKEAEGDAVMVAPPFIVTCREIDQIVRILKESILEIQKSL